MTHNASNQERNCAKNFKTISASDYRQGTIRHLVLFKFKETTTIAIKQSVAQRFIAMQHDATRNGNEYIVSIEHGNQISCEAFGLGFEQGYIVTFQSEGDRNYYVGEPLINDPVHYDPVHHAFKAFVGPLLDERNGCLVFDFRPTLT
jgi:hypothetical protein